MWEYSKFNYANYKANKKQHKKISGMVSQTQGKVFQAGSPLPQEGCFFPPTLITDLHTADPLMHEEIFGPVLVSTTFRTPSEAIELSNNTTFGLAASVWSENINLCLELARARSLSARPLA